jgi:20S proteasome alpha/beta subunit
MVRPEIIHALACAGLLYQKKGMIDTGMSLIIATGTNLASFDAVGGVVVPRSNCVAIGSGYAEALGSLGDGPWTSEDVIKAALAPTKTNVGCGPPIYWATTLDYEIQEFVPVATS